MKRENHKPYWDSSKDEKAGRVPVKIEINLTFYLIDGYLTLEKPKERWERE